ncbi:UPF0014 family [Sesbania bispinosa]|nr:UPF0014 family [Sesbania bispinosa]
MESFFFKNIHNHTLQDQQVVLMSTTDLSWLVEFLKGMLKPVAATAVVFLAVGLSFSQKLGMEVEMVIAIIRAFIQLSIIGFVLQFIFNQENAGWILLAYLFMVTVAGYTAGQRAKHVPRGKYVAGASILTGTAVTMVVLVTLSVFPFTPRYIIPIAGMMVGNSMTVTGVTMKRLRDDIKTQMNLVETALALGATPRQATHQQVKRALIIALSPVVDNTKTVGLISLPGAMTGLIMGGASPLEAIQLQIVVMNMMIGAATFSSIMATYLCWPGFFTKAYQVSRLLLISSIFFFFTYFPGLVLSAAVTLGSIEIFTTHEWLRASPTVYFQCRGDNKTVLPDVKKKHVFYAFKGEESWQPLTNITGKKCKRCGLYEQDSILSDDVFDEWELCPSDFTAPDGKYIHFKEKEFNASFMCPECLSFTATAVSAPEVNHKGKGMHIAVVILLTVLISTVLILGAVGAYKYWQKKKRQQDQARFLKLFEEDDIEDELGLGTII